mmetsp:Transcript_8777/g.12825  ORF Transcript_8777/g.12825 Transcript_8777/m.12825 type:complete len:98 (-) Transcript_8777:276-569(-)
MVVDVDVDVGIASACEGPMKGILIPADLEKAVLVPRIGIGDRNQEAEILGTGPHLQCMRETFLGTTGNVKSKWKIEAKTCYSNVEVQWYRIYFPRPA